MPSLGDRELSLLVLNAGSSSLKFALFPSEGVEVVASGSIDWAGGRAAAQAILSVPDSGDSTERVQVHDHRAAAAHVIELLARRGSVDAAGASVRAVGHRVVHGGEAFRESVLIDEQVIARVGELAALAPLHNPPALATIDAAQEALPHAPHVAVFDTAFFANLAPRAYVYPLPYAWYVDWGVRRFGFHGISHSYCATRAAEMLPGGSDGLRLITCHLGGGASAVAIRGGVAVATTMGFTPLEGLMMGTRPGSVDPGILLHVQRERGLTAGQVDDALNRDSGLLGVSGVSSDYRKVESAAQDGHERAQLALQIYADRVRSTIGALAVTLGGVDGLVFTAGIGENSPALRQAVCQGLECLGVHLSADANEDWTPDADVATAASPARVLVIRTREDAMIARDTRRVVASMTGAR